MNNTEIIPRSREEYLINHFPTKEGISYIQSIDKFNGIRKEDSPIDLNKIIVFLLGYIKNISYLSKSKLKTSKIHKSL